MQDATETKVANLALGKIGGAGDQESGTGLIASIDGTDRISTRCKFLLPSVRRRVFGDLADVESFPDEATEFYDMGAEITPTIKIAGWTYAFTVPPNTIRVRRQIREEVATIQYSITDVVLEFPFKLVWQGTTQLLLTNNLTNTALDSAFIERVFDQANPATWNEKVLDAVATLLGAELVPTVGAVEEARINLLLEYDRLVLPKAKASVGAKDNAFPAYPRDYKGGRNDVLAGP